MFPKLVRNIGRKVGRECREATATGQANPIMFSTVIFKILLSYYGTRITLEARNIKTPFQLVKDFSNAVDQSQSTLEKRKGVKVP